jgi:hypothetical protein
MTTDAIRAVTKTRKHLHIEAAVPATCVNGHTWRLA